MKEKENKNKYELENSENNRYYDDEILQESRPSMDNQVADSILQATEYLYSTQRKGFYWCAELESNVAMTAQYVLLCQILANQKMSLIEQSEAMIFYFSRLQRSNGGWSVSGPDDRGTVDLSLTIETYLALRILGVSEDSQVLVQAKKFIISQGGIKQAKLMTRAFLAMFGLVSWDTLPSIPTELIFIGTRFPINIYNVACWVRSSVVPLLVILHHRPVFALPNGLSTENRWLDHLWVDQNEKKESYFSPLLEQILGKTLGWKTLLGLTDPWVKKYNRFGVKRLRQLALRRCTQWILERQESSGDWITICPTLINYLIALSLQGYEEDSEPIKKGLRAIRELGWEDSQGYRIQSGVSPVWDTAFSINAIIESNRRYEEERIQRASQWIIERQLLGITHGDWKFARPGGVSGGWSMEYFNSWYPNVDCTALVVITLAQVRKKYDYILHTAVKWLLEMQNRDGGWAAFDADNDRMLVHPVTYEFKLLCDVSTPDVTGRVLEALSIALQFLTEKKNVQLDDDPPAAFREELQKASLTAVKFLQSSQDSKGGWFGRWGVNYIYGTSLVLGGLTQFRRTAKNWTEVTLDGGRANRILSDLLKESEGLIDRGVKWLCSVQNSDGGWGESVESYVNRDQIGKGITTPSQTSWALMGLLNSVSPHDPIIERGVSWLIRNQKKMETEAAYEGGHLLPGVKGMTWEEHEATGTRFPKHSYLRYHFYRHYFPMMALGRYQRLRTS